MQLRTATSADAVAVAALHADSWRRHYRGVYRDEYLDGDVFAERQAVWTARFGDPAADARTILAEHDGVLIGFAHVIFDDDPTWGALLDNLHVAGSYQRRGIGAQLLALTGEAVAGRSSLYLWVLEQNLSAQAFYEAHGGRRVERCPVEPPGGVASRITGSPYKLRYVLPVSS